MSRQAASHIPPLRSHPCCSEGGLTAELEKRKVQTPRGGSWQPAARQAYRAAASAHERELTAKEGQPFPHTDPCKYIEAAIATARLADTADLKYCV